MELGSNTETARPDYRSLARAVNGPMRKWWKRVGWWWLLLPLGAIGYAIADAAYLITSHLNIYGRQLNWPAHLMLECGEIIEVLPFAAMLALWLLAAQEANRLFTGLLRETNAPADGRSLQFMYGYGLLQGVVPLAATYLFCSLIKLVYLTIGYFNELKHFGLGHVLHVLNTGLDGLFYLATAMLWLITFAAVLHRRPLLPWLICVPVFVLPGLIVFALNIGNPSGAGLLSSHPTFTGGLISGQTYGFYIGLLAVMFMIRAFQRGWNVPGWIVFSLFTVVSWTNALIICFVSKLYASRLFQTIYGITRYAGSLLEFPGRVVCRCMFDSSNGPTTAVQFCLPHYRAGFPADYWAVCELGYVLINLAWIALLYWFIRGVLLRPRKTPVPVTDG